MTPRSWTLAEAFDRAAPSYDAMVALSPGYHDQLARAAAALVERLPAQATVLDLGCGSGASTQAILGAWEATGRPANALTVLGVDASAGMIGQALGKRWPGTVTFGIDDAVHWLERRADASVDGILAAYLLRNVTDRDALVAEVARVLRPGGSVVLHDYSVAGSRSARILWAGICHGVVIPLAILKRSDVPLHRYLYTSVRDFDSVPAVMQRLTRAGFGQLRHLRHPGWQHGIIHTVVGVRS